MTLTAANPNSRAEILTRIRSALRDVPPAKSDESDESKKSNKSNESVEDAAIPRNYLTAHADQAPAALTDLLAENLADYRAHVHRCTNSDLPLSIARLLKDHGSTSFTAPADLPKAWLTECTGLHHAPNTATARALDNVNSVITRCALAIAETGTIVLDGGPGQGPRTLTLVPDHHICLINCPDQLVASLSQALPLLDPRRPLTWISGPSATSDIEFTRVEGVHGPRTLDVLLVST